MDDPNTNKIWDACMGEDTDTGVVRLIAGLIVFILIGGTVFWLAG